jgi:hypothetical protein
MRNLENGAETAAETAGYVGYNTSVETSKISSEHCTINIKKAYEY